MLPLTPDNRRLTGRVWGLALATALVLAASMVAAWATAAPLFLVVAAIAGIALAAKLFWLFAASRWGAAEAARQAAEISLLEDLAATAPGSGVAGARAANRRA